MYNKEVHLLVIRISVLSYGVDYLEAWNYESLTNGINAVCVCPQDDTQAKNWTNTLAAAGIWLTSPCGIAVVTTAGNTVINRNVGSRTADVRHFWYGAHLPRTNFSVAMTQLYATYMTPKYDDAVAWCHMLDGCCSLQRRSLRGRVLPQRSHILLKMKQKKSVMQIAWRWE